LFCASLSATAAGGEARFFSYPDVRGDRIVFAWEADLYVVGVDGGTGGRLTHHPGGELAPKFSPDGQWIAYTTFNNGVFDVWTMPAEGGTPTRLTWPPLGGRVVAWTPDRHVVFRSRWAVPPRVQVELEEPTLPQDPGDVVEDTLELDIPHHVVQRVEVARDHVRAFGDAQRLQVLAVPADGRRLLPGHAQHRLGPVDSDDPQPAPARPGHGAVAGTAGEVHEHARAHAVPGQGRAQRAPPLAVEGPDRRVPGKLVVDGGELGVGITQGCAPRMIGAGSERRRVP
jgi:dipeptidyl aminopeptidase/acylaminoacyl peptidase